ncbi:MAG: hypothetical protein AAB889_01515, partial [Patescibacteria group bacterium]
FAPARNSYQELVKNPLMVLKILQDGAGKARAVAGQTMKEVREAVGLVNFARPPLVLRQAQDKQQGVAFENKITIEEFGKVEMLVGKVVEATNKEGSEKLIRLVVDFGLRSRGDKGDQGNTGDNEEEKEIRIIFTGVRGFGYIPADFLNKQFFFITNLAPRRMMDEESQGMILAVDSEKDKKPLFVSAEGLPVGAKIR